MKSLYKRYFGSRRVLLFVFTIGLALAFSLCQNFVFAAPNYEINYQGKLTDETGATVADGTYNIAFNLYTVATNGTPIWSSTTTVSVTNGLFSYMLGSDDSITSVDFDQSLYLGVNIGGIGAASWDGEMSPRKIFGSVPSAFEAEHALTSDDATTFNSLATTSFLRSDQDDTASGLLTLTGGLVSTASSTIVNLTTVYATTTNLIINNERFTDLTGTGLTNTGNALTIDTTYLNTLYASTTAFDSCSELAAIVGDTTGTCGSFVLSADPTFTGTVNASALTLSSTLTLSGSTANIALGSNWLSGDGQDEGIFIDGSGNVGVGTSSPASKLDIWGDFRVGTSGYPLLLADTSRNELTITGNTILGGKAYYPSNANLGSNLFGGQLASVEYVNSRDFSNVSNGNLTHIDSDDQGDLAYNVWGDGRFLYLANGAGGTSYYSVSATGSLEYINTVAVGGEARDVWGDGKFIYFASYTGGLRAYSVSDAGLLSFVNADDQGDFAYGVWGDGKFIYLANAGGGLHTYSVDEDGVLTHIDSDDQGGSAWSVWGDGKFVYLANHSGGLHTYSVDDSGVLTHIDSDDQGFAIDVWGDGKFIYLANQDGGLLTYSVDNSGNLTLIDSDDQGDFAYGVWGDGKFIYLANNTGGLHTYSVDDSGILTHIDFDDQGDTAYGVWGDGKFIYLANQDGGLHSYSVNNAYEYNKGLATHSFVGNIGIGSSTPAQALSVVGNLSLSAFLYDADYSIGAPGMVLQTTATGTRWVATTSLNISSGSSITFGTDNQIPYMNAGGTDYEYSSSFTFDGSLLTVGGTGITLSGSTANIALGSNFLSGDGNDEGIYIDSSGRVGIGTSTPTGLFVVEGIDASGSNDAEYALAIYGGTGGTGATGGGSILQAGPGGDNPSVAGGGDGGALELYGGLGGDYTGGDVGSAGQGGNIYLAGGETGGGGPGGADGNVLLAINKAGTAIGNVGIGTVSPSYLLDVAGTAGFDGQVTLSSNLFLSGSTANIRLGSNYLSGDGDDEGIFVDGSGNIGIGTSSPASLLHLYSSNNEKLRLVDADASGEYWSIFVNDSNAISFQNGLINALNIQDDDGYVGIGGTGQDRRLEVTDTSNPQLRLTHTDSTVYTDFQTNASGNLYINASGGRVGIGTSSPNSLLSISGAPAFFEVGNNPVALTLQRSNLTTSNTSIEYRGVGDAWFSGINASGNFAFRYNSSNIDGSPEMVIASSGNVGIGTTSPLSKLDVYGNAILSGSNRYLNFGTVAGSSGYGFRDNAGTLEFKNSGGSWQGVSVATSGPSFRVDKGSDQTISDVTLTGIDWETEDFDTNNNFDLSTERFTPTVPGKYVLTLSASLLNLAAGSEMRVLIYKNGSGIAQVRHYNVSASDDPGASITVIADANGTTDYFTAHVRHNSGGDETLTGVDSRTFFSGAMISTAVQTAGGWDDNGATVSLTDNTNQVLIGVSETTQAGQLVVSGAEDPVFIAEEQGTVPDTTLAGANDVFVQGDYAYIANYDRDSLAVIDISDPTDPVFVAEERGTTPGTTLDGAWALHVSGNYAYIVNDERDSLAVIDISNPSDPVFIAEERGPTPGTSLENPRGIFVAGNYAYVANWTRDSLAIIDISDPTDPVFVAEEQGTTPGTTLDGARAVHVVGNYAYVANSGRDSLAIIDISDPTNPIFRSEEQGTTPGTTLEYASAVFVAGKYAYVANLFRDSLAVIDVSDPFDPAFVAEEQGTTPGTTLDGATDVYVSGNYAYVANSSRDSLAVIDISDPTDPTYVTEEQGTTPGTTLDGARSVFISGNYLYMSARPANTLAVFDIGGAHFNTLTAGDGKIGNLRVNNFAQFDQNADIFGSLNIGHDAQIGGTLTITGTASSSLFAGNTNTALSILSGYVGVGTSSALAKLDIYGDAILSGSNRYLNFGNTVGSTGYGFRDNAGTLEFKNSSGDWTGIGSGSGNVTDGVASSSVAFSVHRNSVDQTGVTTNTFTKIQFTNERYDTNNNFDSSTNYRFQPTIAGKYMITGSVGCVSQTSYCQAAIYKNGSAYTTSLNNNDAFDGTALTSAIIDMNGTTDYIELYGRLNGTTFEGDTQDTHLSGALIAPSNGLAGGWSNNGTSSHLADYTDRVGIGTTSPSAKLDIYGTGNYDLFALSSSSNERLLTVNKDGYLGIGNNNPSSKLTVNSAATNNETIASFNNSNGTARFTVNLESSGASSLQLYDNTNNNDIYFTTVTSAASFINNGGSFGIGTSTPLSKLSVYGNALFEGTDRYLNFGTDVGTSSYGFRDNAGTLEFKNSGGNWTGIGSGSGLWTEIGSDIYFNTGDVGIGISDPDKRLEVFETVADAQFKISYDATRFAQFQVDSVGDMIMTTYGQDVRIYDDNLWVCESDTCPTITASSTAGYAIIENGVYFGNGMKIDQITGTTTELGVYNASGSVIIIFDGVD